MWFNKGDQNSLESGLKRPMGNELCRRLHPNDSRNPFSFTVAPQGVMVWGRGTASAVDRMLSLMAYLRRSFPLFFIPLSPSNLRLFGAPPSIGRRERPREPLPLEGAAERSEAGLASFLAAKPPPSFLIPHSNKSFIRNQGTVRPSH